MKKCVQCRVPIDRMTPWSVCCGGAGSSVVVGAAASAFSNLNNLAAQNTRINNATNVPMNKENSAVGGGSTGQAKVQNSSQKQQQANSNK